jgi:hypothetical protein
MSPFSAATISSVLSTFPISMVWAVPVGCDGNCRGEGDVVWVTKERISLGIGVFFEGGVSGVDEMVLIGGDSDARG